jgi:hypothetical protein
MVDDELMTMPIYRGDWVSSREVHIGGVDDVLHNERLVAAAQQVFDAEVVRPLIVFSNLTAPMPQNRKHTDVPTFRGVERSQYPAWVVQAMATSCSSAGVKVATSRVVLRRSQRADSATGPTAARPEVTIDRRRTRSSATTTSCTTVEAVGDGHSRWCPSFAPVVRCRQRRWRIAKGDRASATSS